jgi:hypothetical protein
MKVTKIETPRQFFDHVVDPDVSDFLAAQIDLRLGYHASISLWSLRDWVVWTHKGQHWSNNGKSKPVFNSNTDLQRALSEIDSRFDIISDLANAAKHLKLTKGWTKLRGNANVAIITTNVISNTGQLGSQLLNTGRFNQVGDVMTEQWMAVDIDQGLFDVVDCVVSTHSIWRSLINENSW